MNDATLVQVIQSLGKRERKELLHWVASSFVNRRPEVQRLCEYLCEQLPFGDKESLYETVLDKTGVYNHVFNPGAKGKIFAGSPEKLSPKADASLRYTMSFLFVILKKWLAWQEFSKDESALELNLYRALRKRRLSNVFEKETKAKRLPASNIRQSTAFYLDQYQLQLERWEAKDLNPQADRVKLDTLCQSFGVYVAVSVLRHGCAALDKTGVGMAVNEIDFLNEVLDKITAGAYSDVVAVQVYYYCFRLMQTSEEAYFQELKALLTTRSHIFPPEEIRDVWLVAINYCIRRLNTGERLWIREAFLLYRKGLEQDLLLENGRMPKASYQNIMLLAIASEEWDWARNFLDDYRPCLALGERSNAYHFNLALWHFRRKDYAAALEILRSVEIRDVNYNIDARRMMVRMYYDEGAALALDSQLHSFRGYLQRHRNIGYHRDLNLNFIQMVQRILRLDPGDKQARERLRTRINNEKYLAEREWLLGLVKGKNE